MLLLNLECRKLMAMAEDLESPAKPKDAPPKSTQCWEM